MSEDLDLQKAVDRLKHQEAYQFIVEEISSYSESAIDELRDIPADKLQEQAGKITAYREILTILAG